MNWLSTFFDYIGKLWPFEKLKPWEEGVKITSWPWEVGFHKWGAHIIKPRTVVVPVGPGAHFVALYFQEILKESTAPRVMDLLPQTITLRDGSQVSFSVNIDLEINDVLMNITKVHIFNHSLEAAARVHLAQRMREFQTFEELIEKQSWLEERLSDTLTTRSKRWGAKINSVGITDLSRSKTFRLLSDAQALNQTIDKEAYA
jgi:hypothetical protein